MKIPLNETNESIRVDSKYQKVEFKSTKEITNLLLFSTSILMIHKALVNLNLKTLKHSSKNYRENTS